MSDAEIAEVCVGGNMLSKKTREPKLLPPQSVLKALLEYNLETGELFWRARGVDWWDRRYAGKHALTANSRGYRCGSILGVRGLYAHRVAWKMHTGEEPNGEIDHINGNKKDNRIANLRHGDSLQNKRNLFTPRHNTSGVMGVRFRMDRNKWHAYISENNRTLYLGLFDRFEDALDARKAAEERLGFHPNHGRIRCL